MDTKSLSDKKSEEHLEVESLGAKATGDEMAADQTRTWSVRASLGVWWRAVMWSCVLSLAVIMESYDTILLNSLYAAPTFQRDFGVEVSPGNYQIPAQWQASINAGVCAAMIIGIFVGAPLMDRFGHRWTMIAGLVMNLAFVFIVFFAQNITMILVGMLLCALPWGFFSVAAPAYAVELCPTQLRSYMVSYVNLCWVIGHIIAAGVLKGCVGLPGPESYLIPFGLQWAPIVPIIVLLFFAPDSPYWLIRRERFDDAVKTLGRLHTPTEAVHDAKLVDEIRETVRMEQQLKTGGSYAACLSKRNIRRTEISTVGWASQGLVGYVVQFFATYFFVRAGMPTQQAFSLGLGNYLIAGAGTVTSWFLQAYFGRRSITIVGLCYMMVFMLLVGILDFVDTDAGRWAQSICLMVWFYGYGSTSGPIAYVIASESPSVTLRAKTMAIARNVYYVALMSSQILAPYFLNDWNLKGKSAFPAFGFSALLLAWAWFRLPEMKGRSFEDLDILFALNLPARRFKHHVITDEERQRFKDLHSE